MGCGKMGGALLKAWAAGGIADRKDFLIIEHNADLVKLYKKQGFEITISTARNMRTYEGNIGKIKTFRIPKQ